MTKFEITLIEQTLTNILSGLLYIYNIYIYVFFIIYIYYIIYIILYIYRGADKSLSRPGRKQTTATEDFDVHT